MTAMRLPERMKRREVRRNPDIVASTEEDDGATVKLRPLKLVFWNASKYE